ncbi:zeta toxin family protein [Serinibacter salmoneus]|uniref:zeta toxin family protein n=1 Tax=Serinibacter salmoneus TaxID=556530 RepID=UPI002481EAD2|nr:zeta toxin family protein [Serinibacter salmoneus]
MLAGPPGAGKSRVMGNDPSHDPSRWQRIDADEFKAALLHEALRDGSYARVLVPPEVRAAGEAGEPFYPMELASLVHEESSMLAASARREALAAGRNVVLDTVLSKPEAAQVLGRQLHAAGYTVEVVDVEVPQAVSEASIERRWREQYLEAQEASPVSEQHLGGRWVPSEYRRSVFAAPEDPDQRSLSQRSTELLAETCPAVVRYRRFEATAAHVPRELVEEKRRAEVGGELRSVPVAGQFRSASFPGRARGTSSRGEQPRRAPGPASDPGREL